jgi:predicted nucleotidyltransferase
MANARLAEILQSHRDEVRRLAAQRRASNPRVFGSAARGDERAGSDIDILVDPLPGATLLDLGGLQAELELLLGVRVDLVTPGELPASFRQQVLSEARPI